MSLKKLKNNTSRNGFDLSKRNIFSAKVGELLPVYCKEVIPGDKFKINVKSFTRTMPVNTAAYTRIKEYYDWFFVPTNLLWNKFNSFVTQMVDNNQHASSPNASLNLGQQHPYFDLQTIYDGLLYAHQQYIETDQSYNPYMNLFGFDRSLLSAKLLDYLGYSDMTNRLIANSTTGQYATNPALNPFPLLAYQKIYSDYFRESQWEKAAAETFNIDYMNASPSATGSFQFALPMSSVFNQYYAGRQTMLDLRYVNWNKDLFMGVKPNSQFGDSASVIVGSEPGPTFGDGNYTIGSIYSNQYDNKNEKAIYAAHTNGKLHNMLADSDYNSLYSISKADLNRLHTALGLSGQGYYYDAKFSILALRQAEALQKWKEITQSQQQDYKAQIEAHFGVSLSDAYSERCHYVDGFSDVIDINEVVNTNLVDGNNLNAADIAGKGVGVNDGYTTFSSDVHGYLMCIYHAVPLLDYSLETRIPRLNLKTQVTDYAIPEFDKIGMVQVPFIEMSNDIELYDDQYQLLGYAPRYYDYKTDVDEIHGSARNRNSAWVAPFDDVYLKTLLFQGNLNGSPKPIDWQFFKVNPAILDSIFVASARADSTTESDQLLTNCMFDVKCVRNLDYDGLPY